MKILKYLPLMAMLATITFVGCKKEKEPDTDMVDDGMYLLGAATVSETPDARLLMAAGLNEVDKTKRDGMYEKYVALEAGKDFWFVSHVEGVGDVKYGSADFAAAKLPTDGDSISGFTGVISANGTALKVPQSGLYHVVLDLDKDGTVGKKLVIVAPCAWGFRGAMNGWGHTAFTSSAFNKEKITFTSAENSTIWKGYEFKFAYYNAWKIVLDPGREQVKAETSLGTGLVTGAGNIVFDQASGLYETVLTWSLAGGANEKSFKTTYNKKGNPELSQFGIAGSFNGWSAGLKAEAVSAGEESYKWTIGPVDLAAGDEFKITDGGTWLGTGDATWQGAYTGNFSGDGNVTVVTAGSYTFELLINYVSNAKTITVIKH